MSVERVVGWALVVVASAGLAAGAAARLSGRPELADLFWTLATLPVIAGLLVSIVRDFIAGRIGVDAIAFISMSAAIALGQPLAGAVVALMYSGKDLSDANLASAKLSDANLSGANLSRAYLNGANLSGAHLTYANLSGANLTPANLSFADLSNATLSSADLILAFIVFELAPVLRPLRSSGVPSDAVDSQGARCAEFPVGRRPQTCLAHSSTCTSSRAGIGPRPTSGSSSPEAASSASRCRPQSARRSTDGCVDGNTNAVKSIKDGRLNASVAQLPYLVGMQAVEDVKKVLAWSLRRASSSTSIAS